MKPLLLFLSLTGCGITGPDVPCFERIEIVPGYEKQVIDSLTATVPADSLWIYQDSSVVLRYQPLAFCEEAP